MDYLVRFVQVHESFRRAELEALADLHNIKLDVVNYQSNYPYCLVRLQSEAAARLLISRSILGQGIYELWGIGTSYEELHEDVRRRSGHKWSEFRTCSFRFSVVGFQYKMKTSEQRKIIESFSYLDFEGPIVMANADTEFFVFQEHDLSVEIPRMLYLCRFIANSDRDVITKYDLKKRHYISTTSMDSELALVTANMAQAAPGKMFFDPFVGTGSFPIACAHFGARSIGSDIDGRSIRGKPTCNLMSNFTQYALTGRWLDGFVSDLTNTPLRLDRVLDGIVCDPPYGVREGLKVLGTKDGSGTEAVYIDGKLAHLQEGYIPPKRPYSFEAMLDDILDFAARTLVDSGRLAMWMPTANDEDVEFAIPTHECLEIVSICVQPFNKWSRRLLTYRRLGGVAVPAATKTSKRSNGTGIHADDLNSFRKKVRDCAALYSNGILTR
ncbi:tRNA guanosine-2'-O-methyltransferase [Rhizodiscina lignyota]|uniref:tRNA (guanine(10)-N(2))-methyltransferase n=1 Tax=Rhizodiscina lignyota TaxID=1504668 RepID=A0A9P4I7H0_9PEZI|nr:tRNA guanosine-2'-O-methyltransferase [Rhizodiscina lignyota]